MSWSLGILGAASSSLTVVATTGQLFRIIGSADLWGGVGGRPRSCVGGDRANYKPALLSTQIWDRPGCGCRVEGFGGSRGHRA